MACSSRRSECGSCQPGLIAASWAVREQSDSLDVLCVSRNTHRVIRNMRTEAPILLPLFRSRGQARLLARVFLHPDERLSLNQLARELDLDPATVQREAERLVEAGILTSERVGTARLVRPNEGRLSTSSSRASSSRPSGPVPVLRERLKELVGVEAAFIHGSWASRHAGERGEAPGDIDLVILGSPEARSPLPRDERGARVRGQPGRSLEGGLGVGRHGVHQIDQGAAPDPTHRERR
jgi:DNA-binding transcriptional ArsR family regulator